MRQRIICMLVNILAFGTVICQERMSFFAAISYNSFSMSNLKEVQQELLNDLEANNIPAKIVESYPSFYGYKGGFLIPLKNKDTSTLSIGGMLEYTSTGGRIHYQDYSGEIREDETTTVFSLGGVLDYCAYSRDGFSISMQLSARYFYSTLNYSLHSRIGNNVNTEILTFTSSSFGLEPAITPKKEIYGIRVGLVFSGLVFIPSTLEYDNYSEAYLVNNAGNKVNINWSGFRIGVIAEFALN